MQKMSRILLVVLLLAGAISNVSQTDLDRYGGLSPEDEFGHLIYFADTLKTKPTTKASVIIYKDERETAGAFLRYFYGIQAFMTTALGVSPDRFDVIYAGQNVRKTEIYLQAVGEKRAIPTSRLDDVLQGEINKKTLFDTACIDCDSSPFINQFIFREGIDYLANALIANPNTDSVVEIPRVESLSKTSREQLNLSREIYERLAQNGLLSQKRVKLRFVKGIFARIYVFPSDIKPKRSIKQT